jgi:hypothetical protein
MKFYEYFLYFDPIWGEKNIRTAGGSQKKKYEVILSLVKFGISDRHETLQCFCRFFFWKSTHGKLYVYYGSTFIRVP